MEKLIAIKDKLLTINNYRKYSIICLHSREIDKAKTRFLQKNKIQCLKKPVQGYLLSKILRKIKNDDLM